MSLIWKIIILLFFIFTSNLLIAQQLNYGELKDYEIGGVKITGAVYSDDQAIISIAGLGVGDRIKIPSMEITRAVKALLKLQLFTEVQILKEKIIGEVIFLEIIVEERARLSTYQLYGLKKKEQEDISSIIDNSIRKGTIVTKNNITNAKNGIENFYKDKGFFDVNVSIVEIADQKKINTVRLIFDITKGEKIKITEILFDGNKEVTDKKLRKLMNNTQKKSKIFANSKLVKKLFEADKKAIIQFYQTLGFRDAQITKDTFWRKPDGTLFIDISITEGQRYCFRNITWKGNTIYDSQSLDRILGIKKGDSYNLELLETRLRFSPDGQDVSSLYMDNGYLFFQVEPVEVAIQNDSIDLEIRIYEGKQATIDKVEIRGNDITNEEVIRREIRTKPGKKFSRSDIIRSQREIMSLGFFNPDPEVLKVTPQVNPNRGTVDIVYDLEEKPSDQIELSAGWQPKSNGTKGSVVGTIGLTLTNFSLDQLLTSGFSNGIPRGDGQILSLRGQTNGTGYQSFNFSFTEPWLGKKKANSLSFVGFYTKQTYGLAGSDAFQSFDIMGGSIRFGTQLKIPDDNFVYTAALNFQKIKLNNWSVAGFNLVDGTPLKTGNFYNLNLEQTLARNTINNPYFPSSGSRISLSLKLTPPFSLFQNNDNNDSPKEKFKLLEYHKWRFDSEWFTKIVGKLVLKTSFKMGALGYYNKDLGLSPFERYQFGGNGINNQGGYTGVDLISMRGYDDETDFPINQNGGATIFNKLSVELRYPISLNPSATIYVLAFADAGNAWGNFRDYNPFDMKRTVGAGLRIQTPMFGLIGADFGWGFDQPTQFGKLSVIFGLEPD